MQAVSDPSISDLYAKICSVFCSLWWPNNDRPTAFKKFLASRVKDEFSAALTAETALSVMWRRKGGKFYVSNRYAYACI